MGNSGSALLSCCASDAAEGL
jgi:hypothetical protein